MQISFIYLSVIFNLIHDEQRFWIKQRMFSVDAVLH